MLIPTIAKDRSDLEQILELQQKNLVGGLSASEWQQQGFVTVQHTIDMLENMHRVAPSIIVKDGDRVVAYALTMLRECAPVVPALQPMFDSFDEIEWKGCPLREQRFYAMGQICIDKAYRGQGLFDTLYHAHRDVYSPQFDILATEIATRNQRSMRAHQRVGFKVISTYRDSLDEWAVVLWDWREE